VISLSDPCSAWTKANKRVQFSYGLNYLIDTENAVIVDVEATPARTYDEVAAAKTTIDRTEQRMGLKPERLAADTAYGTGRFLAWVVAKGIAPHIPVWDHSHRNDGRFSRDDFKFDKERNIYVCPVCLSGRQGLEDDRAFSRARFCAAGRAPAIAAHVPLSPNAAQIRPSAWSHAT